MKLPAATIPVLIQFFGFVFRELFIGALLVLTMRVSFPQSEALWSIYETPADLARFALGAAVCLALFGLLFLMPRTREEYRTWCYLGIAAVPFTGLLAFAA